MFIKELLALTLTVLFLHLFALPFRSTVATSAW